jgi:hypothetical protein
VLTATRPADAEGLVDLSSLPAGVWTLWARADGAGLASASLLVPTTEPLSLTLPAAGTLRLRVPTLIASSQLGTVRLLGADQQPFWTLGPGGAVADQWPLTGGKAQIDGVPAGSWIVLVETPDGQRWQGTAITSGAAEAAVTIE